MQNAIKLKIKTLSNLFIGGMPLPFEIGGIDQQTALDQEGFPCIPGSSLKGALRAIVHEDSCEMQQRVAQLYTWYLERDSEASRKHIQKQMNEDEKPQSDIDAALNRLQKRYDDEAETLPHEHLFGIKGFNHTPKLLFSDFLLRGEFRKQDKCFSVDMKNSIDERGEAPASKPRTYKTARCGLVFEGEIRLYKMDTLFENDKGLCERYIIYNLMKFNEGIYRLGNSKSRGYGKIEVMIENDGKGLII